MELNWKSPFSTLFLIRRHSSSFAKKYWVARYGCLWASPGHFSRGCLDHVLFSRRFSWILGFDSKTVQRSALCRSRRELSNLPSWLDSILIPIYQRKGKRNDWNNWRGLALLSIASKVHAILLNRRLRELADIIVPETQAGFRPEHGATHGVGVIRRVFESFARRKWRTLMMTTTLEFMICLST